MSADLLRIDHAVSSGHFTLDGEEFEVENNIWVLGNDEECLIIDAPHDPTGILDLVAGRKVQAIACTHAHDDHIRMAPHLAALVSAPILLHPADFPLWQLTHQQLPAAFPTEDQLTIGATQIQILHTPGHTPGSVCFLVPELSTVFTGDTLFHGGPGATGRSFSDFPTIISSITNELLTLSANTIVHPGHGHSTTIGAEAPNLDAWITRGY